jgi:hypothetical protein
VKESTGLEKEVGDSSCFIDLAWNLGRPHWVLRAAIAEASLNQHCAEERNPAIAIGSLVVTRTSQGLNFKRRVVTL